MTYALETDDWSYFHKIATKHHAAGDEFIEIPDDRVDEFCRLFYDTMPRRTTEDGVEYVKWPFKSFFDGSHSEFFDDSLFSDPEGLAVCVRAYPDNWYQALLYSGLPVKVIK